jgi:hypothetical protein
MGNKKFSKWWDEYFGAIALLFFYPRPMFVVLTLSVLAIRVLTVSVTNLVPK